MMSSIDLDEWAVDDNDVPGWSTQSPRRPKGMTAGQTIVKKVNNSSQHILYIYICLGKIDTFLVNETMKNEQKMFIKNVKKTACIQYTYLFSIIEYLSKNKNNNSTDLTCRTGGNHWRKTVLIHSQSET